MWHFYEGVGLTIHEINMNGDYIPHKLGSDFEKGEHYQLVIPAGSWFGATVNDTSSYSFVGCTVAPGFNFNDFELAKESELIKRYPTHEKIVIKLT